MGLCRYLNTSENHVGLPSPCPATPPEGNGPGLSAGGRGQQVPEPLRLGPPLLPSSRLDAGRGEQDSKQAFQL